MPPTGQHPRDAWAEIHFEDDSPFARMIRYADATGELSSFDTHALIEADSVLSSLVNTPRYADSGVLAHFRETLEAELHTRTN